MKLFDMLACLGLNNKFYMMCVPNFSFESLEWFKYRLNLPSISTKAAWKYLDDRLYESIEFGVLTPQLMINRMTSSSNWCYYSYNLPQHPQETSTADSGDTVPQEDSGPEHNILSTLYAFWID
ncbi:hypothetical protein A0H81_14445 [Grifola frondosa]|uniref:Uncharacterized protein n=1 Tax=Grifola frondosa TaxID=5627 RepID=A0A1C7LNQ4_GRIFR|nr:hypothetical protein A0H81_14445 [Grifola frondosa]